jgi:hypothetical protein
MTLADEKFQFALTPNRAKRLSGLPWLSGAKYAHNVYYVKSTSPEFFRDASASLELLKLRERKAARRLRWAKDSIPAQNSCADSDF